MFTASLERVLNVAAREALARRHTDLTLEHLLFAAAHDPLGEDILAAAGRDVLKLKKELETFLEQTLDKLPAGLAQGPPADPGLPARAADRGRARAERGQGGGGRGGHAGRPPARAALPRGGPPGRPGRDPPRRAELHLPRDPQGPRATTRTWRRAARARKGGAASRDPLAAYASNLTERARQGKLDPVIGRAKEMGRALEVLCRRRKNNPVFVGEPGVGKTAIVEGLAQRLLQDDCPGGARRAPRSSPSTRGPCSPAPATAATSRSASRP